jgi:cell division protein ZapB
METGTTRTDATRTDAVKSDTAQAELHALAGKLNQLVDVTRKLDAENRTLKSAQVQLLAERAALTGKNEQARSRIEAMINRLKAMEQNI